MVHFLKSVDWTVAKEGTDWTGSDRESAADVSASPTWEGLATFGENFPEVDQTPLRDVVDRKHSLCRILFLSFTGAHGSRLRAVGCRRCGRHV